jgi:hypothetical protein
MLGVVSGVSLCLVFFMPNVIELNVIMLIAAMLNAVLLITVILFVICAECRAFFIVMLNVIRCILGILYLKFQTRLLFKI